MSAFLVTCSGPHFYELIQASFKEPQKSLKAQIIKSQETFRDEARQGAWWHHGKLSLCLENNQYCGRSYYGNKFS